MDDLGYRMAEWEVVTYTLIHETGRGLSTNILLGLDPSIIMMEYIGPYV